MQSAQQHQGAKQGSKIAYTTEERMHEWSNLELKQVEEQKCVEQGCRDSDEVYVEIYWDYLREYTFID
eukprot:1050584-Amphidinium_carterae.1